MATVMTPVKGTYKPGAVGIPLPDVMIRIVDQFNHQEILSPGDTGEIQICAPQLMVGYWQQPDATAAILHDGWLSTRDIGYMDEDGYLYLVDRAKDLIKPSGFQVWPREVEEVLATHPAVREVGVAGIPDPVQSEAVKAWIVLSDHQAATEAELRLYCRERLTAYKVPRFIEFRSSLPKSSVNKVLRRELVAQEKSGKHTSG
jgi:long-chain acyl-CoA synthetase